MPSEKISTILPSYSYFVRQFQFYNDPLYRYFRSRENLHILDVEEIKSILYVPLSHPCVERLIGTIPRGYPDHLLFRYTSDLERKMEEFRHFYNTHRVRASLDGNTPAVCRPGELMAGTSTLEPQISAL